MGRKNTTSDRMKGYMAEGLLLLMQKKPFKEITIQEITDRAGVNRSTYYRNFFSKEEIVLFYLEGIITSYLGHYYVFIKTVWLTYCRRRLMVALRIITI